MEQMIGFKGYITVDIIENDEIISTWESPNLIVDQGLTIFPLMMANKTTPSLAVKVGTSSTAASTTQVNLLAQVAEDLTAVAAASGSSFIVNSLIFSSWSGTIKEFGLYINSLMFSRVVNTTGIVKSSSQNVFITWTITNSRA
jgi:hypothetical protein